MHQNIFVASKVLPERKEFKIFWNLAQLRSCNHHNQLFTLSGLIDRFKHYNILLLLILQWKKIWKYYKKNPKKQQITKKK